MYNISFFIRLLFFVLSGEAVSDGCALKTEYYDRHHGLSDEDKESMSIEELNQHENDMKQKNAWCIAHDIAERVDGEPGPGGGFMRSFVTDTKG